LFIASATPSSTKLTTNSCVARTLRAVSFGWPSSRSPGQNPMIGGFAPSALKKLNGAAFKCPSRLSEVTHANNQAHAEIFGTSGISLNKISDFTDSKWSRTFDEYYRQHIIHVRSNNTLLLRFQYDYEVDLDRIKTQGQLLGWVSHLCGKIWMTRERIHLFIEVVAAIQHIKIHGGL
jgi:hypothetical protein